MGYTKNSPQYLETINNMVNNFTLDQCKIMLEHYKTNNIKLGIQQVEETMRLRRSMNIDPSDSQAVKNTFATRIRKIVNGKHVDDYPVYTNTNISKNEISLTRMRDLLA